MDLKLIKIAENTTNYKHIKKHSHKYKHKNTICGDEIEITLKIKDRKIIDFGLIYFFNDFIKSTIFFALKSLLLISIPTAIFFFIFDSKIFTIRDVGRLSIASNPMSSSIFKALVLPAPDNPVISITLLVFINFI